MSYSVAYAEQLVVLERVLAAREAGGTIGEILLVEHDPVITVTRKAGAAEHVTAPKELLARMGIEVVETDRGGDVTYHGPGQLVVYPIVDLNLLNLGLHEYMRLLEETVIRYCARHGIHGVREPGATGVWVDSPVHGQMAKIAAMGVRVRRWITMHGLSLNVSPDLRHFSCIVPCGLVGRPVTSMREQLGEKLPPIEHAARDVGAILTELLMEAYERACQKREGRLSGAGGDLASGADSSEGHEA